MGNIAGASSGIVASELRDRVEARPSERAGSILGKVGRTTHGEGGFIFINTFTDWLAAFGTLAAVITALYLARKESRIDLKVVAGIRLVVQRGSTGKPPEYINVDVTNLGRRQARITGLYWRDGFPLGVRMGPATKSALFAGSDPITLADGDRAAYLVLWSTFEQSSADLAGHFAGWRGWIRAYLFRAGVSTSAGGTFETRIEKSLRDRLLTFGAGRGAAY